MIIRYIISTRFGFVQGGGATTNLILSSTVKDPGWTNDPYASAYAFAFFGDTNSTGLWKDSSKYNRHAAGGVQAIIGTNSRGMVESARYYNNTSGAIGSTNSGNTTFLNGVTSMVMYCWVKDLVHHDYGGYCACRNGTLNFGIVAALINQVSGYVANGDAASSVPNSGNWNFIAYSWTAVAGVNVWMYVPTQSATPIRADLPHGVLVQDAVITLGKDTADANRYLNGWLKSVVCYTNVNIPLSHATNFYLATTPTNMSINY